MNLTQRYLISALVTAPAVLGLVVAPPATADCSSSGYATVCAQGDVRGGNGAAPVTGPVDPYPCADDWMCNDGVDIVWGPMVRPTYARAEICDPNGYHIELRQWFR